MVPSFRQFFSQQSLKIPVFARTFLHIQTLKVAHLLALLALLATRATRRESVVTEPRGLARCRYCRYRYPSPYIKDPNANANNANAEA